MRYFVTVHERTFQVDLTPDGVLVDGEPVSANLEHVEGTELRSLLLDAASYGLLPSRQDGGHWEILIHGRRFAVDAVDERTRAIREMTGAGGGPAGPKPIRAPMPGLVVKVEVSEGDTVVAGQGVAIVEAMKMENELKADAPGVVTKIHVAPGQTVDKDEILIDLKAPDDGTASEKDA